MIARAAVIERRVAAAQGLSVAEHRARGVDVLQRRDSGCWPCRDSGEDPNGGPGRCPFCRPRRRAFYPDLED